MKRWIALLLCLVTILSCCPTMVFAANNVTPDSGDIEIPITPEEQNPANEADYNYEVTGGKATITGYKGAGGDIIIPACLDGYPVTTIGRYAFWDCSSLTSVTIPDCVTTVGWGAFESCNNLTSVIFMEGVQTIECSAFDASGLASVVIPPSVTTIGNFAFANCYSLTGIWVDENNPSYSSDDRGVLFNKGKTTLIQAPCAITGTYTIPDSVTTIHNHAFFSCENLTGVTIPDSVTTIEWCVFDHCDSLTDVYYNGTKEQWNAIAVDEDNESLLNATIHYKAAAHTHSHTKKVTKPTCTAKGYTTYTCSCGDTYKANYVKALGHTYKTGSCTRCKYKPAGAKITTQPVNVAVKSGKTAKVTVKASGSGLKYTWYYAKKGSSKYTKTTVTSSSYSVKMSSSVSGRKVYCVVTDAYGNSVKSNVVTLYKGTPAKIKTQPKGVTVASGKSGKLTIKASGSSLKYSWYIKYKGATSFTKVGKSSKTYSFKMTDKLDGAQVYCVVKDKYGITVKSSVVTIKAAPKIKITTQPKSAKAFSGKTVKFTVKASGEGLKYQWYYAKKGSSKFKKLSAKSATYSVKVSSSVNGRKYYCVVTDKYGQTVKTSVVTLTMQKAAKITTQPKNVSVKNGKTAKVTIKATGDGLKYTWYYLISGQTKYTKATFTGNTFSVKMAAKYKNCKVYCRVSDQYGNSVKSKTVTLKMK